MDDYNGLEQISRAVVDLSSKMDMARVFNFRHDNGKCYGYTPPCGKINLPRISNSINHDALGDYIDDVL